MYNEVIDALEGEQIKEIFRNAEEIAKLHATLTSPRGHYFRLALLQLLEKPQSPSELNEFRQEQQMGELQRHMNMLRRFNLIAPSPENEHYERTEQGESAINSVRRLEVRIGDEAAEKIYQASLSANCIRVFLRLFGENKEPDLETLRIRYTPSELGKLCLFLPRNIEGIAAIDKLSDAELLVYEEDGNYIYQEPRKVRSFYQYLRAIYRIAIPQSN